MAQVIINVAAKCDKAGRRANQDNYWICPDLSRIDESISEAVGNDQDVRLSRLGALLVVADGMGGMNAGEKASELIIHGVRTAFSNIPTEILDQPEQITTFMRDTIIQADQSVKDYAIAHPETDGMGSTIVMAWVLGEKVYTAWVGDSRIYCFNPGNELVRLSHDHSYVQRLVDEGKLDAALAFDHPDTNIITRSLGDNHEVANPETHIYDIHRGDILLLCSDGLCGLLRDNEIEDILAQHATSMSESLAALWQAGEEAEFSDNCTIELLRVVEGGAAPKGVATGYDSPQRKARPAAAAAPQTAIAMETATAVADEEPITIINPNTVETAAPLSNTPQHIPAPQPAPQAAPTSTHPTAAPATESHTGRNILLGSIVAMLLLVCLGIAGIAGYYYMNNKNSKPNVVRVEDPQEEEYTGTRRGSRNHFTVEDRQEEPIREEHTTPQRETPQHQATHTEPAQQTGGHTNVTTPAQTEQETASNNKIITQVGKDIKGIQDDLDRIEKRGYYESEKEKSSIISRIKDTKTNLVTLNAKYESMTKSMQEKVNGMMNTVSSLSKRANAKHLKVGSPIPVPGNENGNSNQHEDDGDGQSRIEMLF